MNSSSNKPNWKKRGLIAVSLILVAAAGYYVFSRKDNKPTAYVNPAFAQYISSYTAWSVSSGSSIHIVLSKDVIDSSAVGEATQKLFDFSPSVKGITVWLDRRTVEFKPAGRLKPGQVYEVSFFLSKLMQVPGELSTFEYSFQVTP